MALSRPISLFWVVWLVIGVVVAMTHDYFAHARTAAQIGSAVLAVIAWPLVLLNVHIAI